MTFTHLLFRHIGTIKLKGVEWVFNGKTLQNHTSQLLVEKKLIHAMFNKSPSESCTHESILNPQRVWHPPSMDPNDESLRGVVPAILRSLPGAVLAPGPVRQALLPDSTAACTAAP